jgi:hypothetical protein
MKGDYDDFLWYVKLGIELGFIDKDKMKITLTFNDK